MKTLAGEEATKSKIDSTLSATLKAGRPRT